MASLSIKPQNDGHIHLSGAMNRQTVAQQWPITIKPQANNSDTPCVIDCAAVEDVDTAGLAWLVALYEVVSQHCNKVVFKNLPSNLLKLAKISDVEALLPLQ